MKPLLALLCLAGFAFGQVPKTEVPKPPVGVPADAQFFNGKWYRIYSEKVPWNRAKDRCKSLGGQMACATDKATWDFVKQLAGGAALWLGATDEELQGRWKWVSGAQVTYAAWFPGQPDNAGGKEHYAAIYKNAWADVQNSGTVGKIYQVQGFICEWAPK